MAGLGSHDAVMWVDIVQTEPSVERNLDHLNFDAAIHGKPNGEPWWRESTGVLRVLFTATCHWQCHSVTFK